MDDAPELSREPDGVGHPSARRVLLIHDVARPSGLRRLLDRLPFRTCFSLGVPPPPGRVARMLEKAGYRVTLQRADRSPSGSERPDDVVLYYRVLAVEEVLALVRALKTAPLTENVPILGVLAGWRAAGPEIRMGWEAGVDSFGFPPVSSEAELPAWIERLVDPLSMSPGRRITL